MHAVMAAVNIMDPSIENTNTNIQIVLFIICWSPKIFYGVKFWIFGFYS